MLYAISFKPARSSLSALHRRHPSQCSLGTGVRQLMNVIWAKPTSLFHLGGRSHALSLLLLASRRFLSSDVRLSTRRLKYPYPASSPGGYGTSSEAEKSGFKFLKLRGYKIQTYYQCTLPQPLEHSNYRRGVKRITWAHLPVSPTRDSYATHICSTAVLLRLPGRIYQINGAREKLQKRSGDVNEDVMWQGGGWKGDRRPPPEVPPSHSPKRQPPAVCPAGTAEGRKGRKASSAPSSFPLH